MDKLHSETGGAWFPRGRGILSATWPFVRLDITQESIHVYVRRPFIFIARDADYLFKLDDIKLVKRKRLFPIVADGIEITSNNMVRPITFWSLRCDNLVEVLKSNGLQVN